jgi:hypothetical protein
MRSPALALERETEREREKDTNKTQPEKELYGGAFCPDSAGYSNVHPRPWKRAQER